MAIDKIITLVGILVSLIIGLTSIYIGVQNSKKTIFINSVTTLRAKWMDTIRNAIAEYCSLTYLITIATKSVQAEKLFKLQQLRYLIKLQLDKNDKIDSLIVNSVDSIYNSVLNSDFKNTTVEIDKLICLTQDLLKLEWEGVKEETKKGNLSKREKNRLYNRHLKKYQNGDETV
ncbi:hypothetical protein [Microbacter margulisiae]|uniref:Uncharacterized protein n=1 Tax=Microbacter margulisiae TaxID=1350067 RepID=A0A7W5DPE2_9PORP|nr:hypothetical protein [Microbacter margulisiae]MBB3186640.1 hypothetical protein [Microbacter margulisiae]